MSALPLLLRVGLWLVWLVAVVAIVTVVVVAAVVAVVCCCWCAGVVIGGLVSVIGVVTVASG